MVARPLERKREEKKSPRIPPSTLASVRGLLLECGKVERVVRARMFRGQES